LWGRIVLLFGLDLLSTPIALLTPLPLKIVVDSVIGTDPLPGFLQPIVPTAWTTPQSTLLLAATGALIAIALARQLRLLSASLLRTWTAERLVLDFRARLFRHVQRLSPIYHDRRGSSDAAYRIERDAAAIQHVAIDGVIPFVVSLVTLVSMFYVIVKLDWQLSIVAVGIAPGLFMLMRVYRMRLRRRSREVKRLESRALSVVYEVLTSLRVVKAFGQERKELDRFVTTANHGMRERVRLAIAENGLALLVGLTTAAGTAAILFIGTTHVQQGTLTLGELLLIMSYLVELYSPMRTISRKVASLQGHLASAERAFTLLDERPDVPEKADARPLVRAHGWLRFDEVTFAYAEGTPVLHRASFEVSPGRRVGVAGRTGSGKSTLLHLLTRFFDPSAGRILLDGVDLHDYRLADLRNQFAIVLQEPVLFSTSIAENIAYARPDASQDDLVAAARAADAHDFIRALPEGYETRVGERGMRLSGGERQRIALARAFLKDAPILILDEPTSSVDVGTEAGILETLERLMQGRTTFMVAHRLATLRNCDTLLHIEDGRIQALSASGSELEALIVAGRNPGKGRREKDAPHDEVSTARGS
jgi:ATP-binding cassette subfamily B protein